MTKKQITQLTSIAKRIEQVKEQFNADGNGKDISLHYGNGSVYSQLDVALASIDTILQEFI